MSRSVYFPEKVQSESDILESIIIESIGIQGYDMYYIPRNIASIDRILNEDTESRFDSAFLIEMYISSVDSYGGDGILMSKFGLELRNQIKLVVSRRKWETRIGVWNKGYNSYRPSEGDLIYVPYLKGLFEIKYVDLESPFKQLNNWPTYTLTVELFEYRGEKIATGQPDIDAIMENSQLSLESSWRFIVSGTALESFILTEDVEINWPTPSAVTASGTLEQVTPDVNGLTPYKILTVNSIKFNNQVTMPVPNFVAGMTITGAKSGTVSTVESVVSLESGDDTLSDGSIAEENSALERRANDIIDYTAPENPFGSPRDDN